ncbi:MAG: asparagine synthase (glutamine-hydrolyzing) [Phycisphaerales bacterium]|nr:asparagine synthase (glutamine-hydrolyzing) [Phycisphaerales bacterium]
MCGIVAIIDERKLDQKTTQSPAWLGCMDRLARRGPDGSGSWTSPSGHAALGHTRLAIVDPSERGHQPMTDADGQVSLSFNGEIYNAPQLRDQLIQLGHRFNSTCDTEVLLAGWMHWGREIIEHIRGMFSFVIWDDRAREVFAAVDHSGMKPLVFKHENGRLMITSDADAMRALTEKNESLNPTALRHVLTLGCCPSPMTMLTGIEKLRGGHTLSWKLGGRVRIERHWSPPENMLVSSIDEHAFKDLWERVISDHLLSDVPVGVFLSGGLDSASVTSAMTRVGARPRCFTLAMEGEGDESRDANRVANRLGLECDIADARWDLADELGVYAQAYDEPQSHSALLTQTRICAHASRHVKTLLGGDGGDEAFGGYLWQRETGKGSWESLHKDDKLRSESGELSKIIGHADAPDCARNHASNVFGAHSFIHGYLSRVFPGFHPAEACALTQSMGDQYNEHTAVEWLIGEDRPQLEHLRRVQRLDLVGFCANSILPKIDRGSMHFGLEVRSPLLDRRLLEYGLAAPVTPGEMLGDASLSRPHLRRYAASALGDAFINRPKQGFSLRLKGEWEQWTIISKAVNRSRLVTEGYLREDWRSFIPHRAVYKLRSICMLSAWAESRL